MRLSIFCRRFALRRFLDRCQKHDKLAAIWLIIVLAIPYGCILLLLVLTFWPDWQIINNVPVLNATVYGIIVPTIGLAAVLVPRTIRRYGRRLIGQLRRPKVLAALTLFSILVTTVSVIKIQRMSKAVPVNAVIDMTARAHLWEPDSVEATLVSFANERLSCSRYREYFQAYAYSIAARNGPRVSYPDQERVLLKGTESGQPLGLRVVCHLGLANLRSVVSTWDSMHRHLERAARIGTGVAGQNGLRRLVLANKGVLLFSAASSFPDDSPDRRRWLTEAQRTYDEWLECLPNGHTWEMFQVLNGRAIARFLDNDVLGARLDWEQILYRIGAAGGARHELNRSLLASVHNNIGMAYMTHGQYETALLSFRNAISIGAGNTRTTRLNEMICLKRLGRSSEAERMAEDLAASSTRPSEHALFGWVHQRDTKKREHYEIALDLTVLPEGDLTEVQLAQLARLCTDAFVGLDLQAREFQLTRE